MSSVHWKSLGLDLSVSISRDWIGSVWSLCAEKASSQLLKNQIAVTCIWEPPDMPGYVHSLYIPMYLSCAGYKLKIHSQNQIFPDGNLFVFINYDLQPDNKHIKCQIQAFNLQHLAWEKTWMFQFRNAYTRFSKR